MRLSRGLNNSPVATSALSAYRQAILVNRRVAAAPFCSLASAQAAVANVPTGLSDSEFKSHLIPASKKQTTKGGLLFWCGRWDLNPHV